jgi:hypothetical protein
MAEDKLQLSRFELKYLIHERTARQIRDFVSSYLALDEYGAGQPNLSYPIHSLYLDSDALTTYEHTINGNCHRYKLRLRYYDERPTSPIFFEIKGRVNNTIVKQRSGVRRSAAKDLLAGHLPYEEHLLSKDPRQLISLHRFCHLMHEIHAKPKVHIFYVREAWISTHDNSVRVTMDRAVQADHQPAGKFSTRLVHPVTAYKGEVILELKFTNRFPNWFNELVTRFDLMQCGAAKYVSGIDLLGHDRVRRSFAMNAEGFAVDYLAGSAVNE